MWSLPCERQHLHRLLMSENVEDPSVRQSASDSMSPSFEKETQPVEGDTAQSLLAGRDLQTDRISIKTQSPAEKGTGTCLDAFTEKLPSKKRSPACDSLRAR